MEKIPKTKLTNNNEGKKILLVYMNVYSLAILFITVWYWHTHTYIYQYVYIDRYIQINKAE